MKKIKVLIIDDSAVMRTVLTEILSSDGLIDVIGTAANPIIARKKIKRLKPDILTLDVEMPEMDGLSFLDNLMRLRPMPVVMLSSLTEKGADITLRALGLGAVDFIAKPKIDVVNELNSYREEIISKVKGAAIAKIDMKSGGGNGDDDEDDMTYIERLYTTTSVLKRVDPAATRALKVTDKIIAIGASTGGIEAIKDILIQMHPDSPGTLVVQHIPALFSKAFAKRMDSISPMAVCEAEDGQIVSQGHVYIAPGDRHLILAWDGQYYRCKLDDGPAVNRHKPSVDVLFRSVAQTAGKNAVGIILTGMGSDGARGLAEMHEAEATTIAQDEKTSMIWGMPGEAVKLKAVDHILPLMTISDQIDNLMNQDY